MAGNRVNDNDDNDDDDDDELLFEFVNRGGTRRVEKFVGERLADPTKPRPALELWARELSQEIRKGLEVLRAEEIKEMEIDQVEDRPESTRRRYLTREQEIKSKRIQQRTASGLLSALMGEAGTGKSHVIKFLWLLESTRGMLSSVMNFEEAGDVYVVAGTQGRAAKNVHGKTIHSLLGFMGDALSEPMFDAASHVEKNMRHLMRKVARWQWLVIDEVGLLSPSQLERIEEVIRLCRERAGVANDPTKAFGGLPVLLTGDFFQLPPIITDGRGNAYSGGQIEREGDMVFRSHLWEEHAETVMLEEQNRQLAQGKDEDEFRALLSNVRWGVLTARHRKFLLRAQHHVAHPSSVHVHMDRASAASHNAACLSEVKGPYVAYRNHVATGHDLSDNYNLKECLAQETALMGRLAQEYPRMERPKVWSFLKVGAQVEFSCTCTPRLYGDYIQSLNLACTEKIYKGTACEVVDFVRLSELDADHEYVGDPAWVQLLCCHNERERPVRRFQLQCVAGIRMETQPELSWEHAADSFLPVIEIREEEQASRTEGALNSGRSRRRIVVFPVCLVKRGRGRALDECSTRLPLELAYSFTVHSIQGKSFPHLVATITDIYPQLLNTPAMLYVILSRCTSFTSLVLRGPLAGHNPPTYREPPLIAKCNQQVAVFMRAYYAGLGRRAPGDPVRVTELTIAQNSQLNEREMAIAGRLCKQAQHLLIGLFPATAAAPTVESPDIHDMSD